MKKRGWSMTTNPAFSPRRTELLSPLARSLMDYFISSILRTSVKLLVTSAVALAVIL